MDRREFLRASAGLLIGSSVVTGCGSPAATAAPSTGPDGVRRPNIVVILTDQERSHVHWPEGLLERLMPSWNRLASQGLSFRRAYCAASQCSPSRACLLTGEYSNVNGVPTLPDDGMPSLPDLPNLASVLASAGYEVVWKGKWHLSFPLSLAPGTPPSQEVWGPEDIPALESRYGMRQWNPPDAGNNAGAFGTAGVKTMGGGLAANDDRIVRGVTQPATQQPGVSGGESVLDFLNQVAATPIDQRKPFALFVSLVNPHDITFFPTGWDVGGYHLQDFANLGVGLPPNGQDSLNGKPSIQKNYRDTLQQRDPLFDDPSQGPTPSQYVNFYAYLHGVVEPEIQTVLNALDQHQLTQDTLIVRTADHGEGGLSHGLREKSYSAYEEMIHVPLVISNPRLFPKAQETSAYWSHVDLLPTLAELAQASPVGVGKSLVPVLLNPNSSVQDSVLFSFDDNFVLPAGLAGSRIRALRWEHWTYAVYFGDNGGPFEYELYNNQDDPLQMRNLIPPASPAHHPVWLELHRRLLSKMQETNSAPRGFSFPTLPDV